MKLDRFIQYRESKDDFFLSLPVFEGTASEAGFVRSMREIKLAGQHGLVSLVNDADYERFRQFPWYSDPSSGGNFRAVFHSGKKKYYLHREIMSAKTDEIIDHINGDGLDNRRENLRFATRAQNSRNRRGTTSLPKGVHFKPRHANRPYVAAIKFNGHRTHLGAFKTEREAGLAYDRMARILHGEFARLNFPEITDYEPMRCTQCGSILSSPIPV